MATVKKSTVINAPPERVFAYVTEPATMSEWLAKMDMFPTRLRSLRA